MDLPASRKTLTFIIHANDSGALTAQNRWAIKSHSRRRPGQKQTPLQHINKAFFEELIQIAPEQAFDPLPENSGCHLRESGENADLIRSSQYRRRFGLQSTSMLGRGLNGALDPFCRLACETSVAERLLIQHYLRELPALLYGVIPNAVICPVRMHTIPSLQNQPLWVKWVILHAEASIITRRRIPPPASFFQRKAAIYRTLSEALADPLRRYTDETIVGLGAASVMESRSPNPTAVLVHLKGYDTVRRDIIKQRSGSLEKPFIEWMWSPFVGAYLPPTELTIHTFSEFEEAKQLFLNTMRTMQTWNTDISSSSVDSDQEYKALLRTTVQSSTIRHFFSVSPSSGYIYTNTLPQREQFVILFTLNLLLYKLRADVPRTTRILSGLKAAIDGSALLSLDGRSTLKPAALRFFLNYLEMQHAQKLSTPWDELPLGHTCTAALKIMNYLSESNKVRVLELLSGWLLDDDENPSGRTGLSEGQIAEMGREVSEKWWAQRVGKE